MWNQFLLEMTQFYSWVVFVVKWEMPKVIGKNLDLDKGTIQKNKKEEKIKICCWQIESEVVF